MRRQSLFLFRGEGHVPCWCFQYHVDKPVMSSYPRPMASHTLGLWVKLEWLLSCRMYIPAMAKLQPCSMAPSTQLSKDASGLVLKVRRYDTSQAPTMTK